jgi:thiol:disulfide interchange protein
MRNLFLTSLFFIFYQLDCSGQINFVKFDWEQIKQTATKEKKLIMVDMTATWCYWCKMMEKKVFSKEKVAVFYNASYVSSKLYDNDPAAEEFSKKFNINSFPTFLFFDSKGNLINKIEGAIINPNDFIYEGKQIQKINSKGE